MGIKSINLSLVGKTVFYDGDLVEGICELEVGPGQTFTENVTIKYRGQAKTSWLEKKGRLRIVEHTATVLLLNSQTVLNKGLGLQPGRHQLPFSFRLPSPVATSFEGSCGYVRYWIEAEVPGNWLPWSGKNAKLQLNVLQLIDTNLPQYRFPVTGKDNQGAVCCCCCASGPLFIEATTDRAAYCPNDVISITASFRNDSAKKQARPYAKLVQKSLYKDSDGETKEGFGSWDLEPVGNTDGTQNYIFEGGSATWNGMQFKIPEVFPSVECGIIQIRYEIEIGLDVPWAFDLEVYLPVVIATVPFRGEPMTVNYQPAVETSSQFVQWAGTGKSSGNSVKGVSSAPPLLAPVDMASGRYQPPTYFETLLSGQVPQLDKDDHGNNTPTVGQSSVAPYPTQDEGKTQHSENEKQSGSRF